MIIYFKIEDMNKFCIVRKAEIFSEPWLVRLGGLRAGLLTKGMQVRFPVRAHAWVVGQDPRVGRRGA